MPRIESSLSSWYISNRTIKALLRPLAKPNHLILEIGSAPGLWLTWIHQNTRTTVSGIDYSTEGIAKQKELFSRRGVDGESRCEDVLTCSFPENTFDVVYSLGVIEHYNDPTAMIDAHLRLAKPGGTVAIVIPNYSGLHLALQWFFDSENLKIHNLNLMNYASLQRCAPKTGVVDLRISPFGRFDPGLITLKNRLPPLIAALFFHFSTLLSHLIPVKLHGVRSMWLMSFQKGRELIST